MESVKHTLSSIVDIISGGTPSTANPDYWNGDIGWLSVADFNNDQRFVYYSDKTITRNGLNNSSTKLLSIGDTIISARGTVGALAQIGNEMAFNQSCFGLRAKQEFLNEDFLYYSLRNYVKNLKAKSQGSVFDTINLSTFDMIELEIPSLPHQQKIASVLSTLDEKIALNNQINATLEQMAKTLYDYWFVQFDFPDENGKPYKSSGGEMVYNETLKRDIPKGWEVETLDKHISIKRGISYKSHEIQETGTPFLNLNSFYLNGSFKVEGTKFFNGTTKSENLLKTGDLVVAVTDVTRNADIIGKSFIVPNIYEESFLMSCDVAMIKSEKLPNSYLEKLFNSYNYHEYIKHYASGTLVLHLDTKGIGWFETFIPSSNVLKKYDDLVQQIIARKIESIKQNAELIKIRDWLLPMLMNGQVTVQ
ncbi:restriction endonuclease subunit S [Moraxella osloensis]|nr:restriction endonuclease subunit S [Moraxella osloensis]MBW4019439.1 restriction endonuclease subunit S [Moraxella osloensis]